MKFSIARIPSNVTLCQRLRLQRSARVNDLTVGLEIPTNSFRTKLATGKISTPLCFFCKCTPNYLYIDLKRSLSHLTSGQYKFDLRTMSKTSKLCHDVYHSTRFDGMGSIGKCPGPSTLGRRCGGVASWRVGNSTIDRPKKIRFHTATFLRAGAVAPACIFENNGEK